MLRDFFTEIEGPEIGRTFDLVSGTPNHLVIAGRRLELVSGSSPAALATLEKTGVAWRLRLAGSPVRIAVKRVDEERETEVNLATPGGAVVLEDSNLLSVPADPAHLRASFTWLFQHDDEASTQDEDGLYSPVRKTHLSRRRTLAIRAVLKPRNPFGGLVPVPDPVAQWGLEASPFRRDIEHVFELLDVDPAVAVKRCRFLLKGALRSRYRAAVGDPADMRVPRLARELASGGHLPTKIVGLVHALVEMTAPGGEPVLAGAKGAEREAGVVLWCLVLFLDWHQRSRG
ncbi:MAG: hypothetical protein HY720_27175 [Planctomycetes bacterium]|nr:hypothetical protein [Planctomycetota bacterium]